MKKLIPALTITTLALTLAACGSAAWNETDEYAEYCSGDPSIGEEVAALADVEIPEGGHIKMAQYTGQSVNVRVCVPLTGDDLRPLAEELAITVKTLPIADTVERMTVHAWPDDEDPESRLADNAFQMRLHDGTGDRGAVLAAWEPAAE